MGGRIPKFLFAAALAAAATPAFADWRELAAPADIDRLAQLPQIRAAAIADAQDTHSGRCSEQALAQVMDAEGRSIPAQALAGNWRCREMKLGRMTSYMVYDGWFACAIRRAGDGLELRKLNGSQRFMGHLFPENGVWVYLGASSARGEPYHDYSGRSPALGAAVTPDDQIGLLTGIGNNHLRLEMPAAQESLLDVVEFRR